MIDSSELENRSAEIETAMSGGDFWSDKDKAQAMVRELGEKMQVRALKQK